MKYGLKESTLQLICTVLAQYPRIEKAILFGSRAKGNYKNGSDIDLTLIGGKDLTNHILYRVIDALDDLLLPYTIDLSIFSNISDTDVINHIQRVGLDFYTSGQKYTAHSIGDLPYFSNVQDMKKYIEDGSAEEI